MTVLTRPDAIRIYQLKVIKSALKLEQKGLRHSSGALRPKWASRLDLRPRSSYEEFHAAIDKKIAELEANILI